ncbi:unnamed protein product, partial [Pylaiella littoralis]
RLSGTRPGVLRVKWGRLGGTTNGKVRVSPPNGRWWVRGDEGATESMWSLLR